MNKVILCGRLTAKPELRYTTNNIPVSTFSMAVQRDFKNADGEYDVDFINCFAFRKTGELISEYFDKGDRLLINGSIRISNYENEKGEKRQSTRVLVESFDFINNNKKENTNKKEITPETEDDPFAAYGEQIEIDDDGEVSIPDDFLD